MSKQISEFQEGQLVYYCFAASSKMPVCDCDINNVVQARIVKIDEEFIRVELPDGVKKNVHPDQLEPVEWLDVVISWANRL